MRLKKNTLQRGSLLAMAYLAAGTVSAHDPVFGVGPHVLYKNGLEVHLGAHQEKSDNRTTETELELKYGITGDWVAGIGTSYHRSNSSDNDRGRGPSTFSTKYRFWRNDMFTAQESAAVFGKVIFDDGDSGRHNIERDGNDYLLGLTYGYEGRKWYRWASVRHRFNADTSKGAERPNVWLVDLVGGIRFSPTEYHEPDWVWMLELNGELIEQVSQQVGSTERTLGGDQWFLSPGLMWTWRNVALKAGVQLPIVDDLSADQHKDNYRALIELEWHL